MYFSPYPEQGSDDFPDCNGMKMFLQDIYEIAGLKQRTRHTTRGKAYDGYPLRRCQQKAAAEDTGKFLVRHATRVSFERY
jgi:hypothetical protein